MQNNYFQQRVLEIKEFHLAFGTWFATYDKCILRKWHKFLIIPTFRFKFVPF